MSEGSPYEPTQAAGPEPPGMRPGHGGYEFKTKVPMSVYVYIYMNLHGIDALLTVFARFAGIRLSGPQPEVTWTLVRILDRAGVRASR